MVANRYVLTVFYHKNIGSFYALNASNMNISEFAANAEFTRHSPNNELNASSSSCGKLYTLLQDGLALHQNCVYQENVNSGLKTVRHRRRLWLSCTLQCHDELRNMPWSSYFPNLIQCHASVAIRGGNLDAIREVHQTPIFSSSKTDLLIGSTFVTSLSGYHPLVVCLLKP